MKTLIKRYGRKDNTPAAPAVNKDETQEAYLKRCKDAKVTDEAAKQAWKAHEDAPKQDQHQDNEVTTKEISRIVTEAVQAAIKALPTPPGEDVIKKLIDGALEKLGKDSTKIDLKAFQADLTKSLQTVVEDAGRRPRKNVRNPGDADRDMIEVPFSWTKGNLPLHAKQLLNVLMHPNLPMQDVINKGIDEADLQKGEQLGERMVQKYRSMARAGQKAILTSTGSGTGDELVPTDLSAELQRRFYLSSDLAAVMAAREVDMPTQPYDYPLSTTRPTFYLETTEGTEATESQPGTGQIVLDAKKLMGRVGYSYEIDEDSIVPILNTVQTLLSESAAAAYESCLINGDTTATHMDSDTQTVAKAAERAFKGWRKLSLAVAELKKDLSTGGISEANLRAMKKAMGKYGVRVRDLIWICGPSGKNDIEAIANVATVDKYGSRATILTGELSNFLNIPIISSEACRENLNASGVYDGSTVTKGSILLVNATRFLAGRRRAFTIESFRDIKKQQNDIVASYRRAFVPIETPSATVPTCVVGYNYAA